MARAIRATAAWFLAAAIAAGCGGGNTPEPQREPAVAAAPPARPASGELRLPKKVGSLRFAAIGDAGRGDQWQYDVSAQMQAYRTLFPFDRDYHFMLVEISGDELYFQTISRTGVTIDAGSIRRRKAP